MPSRNHTRRQFLGFASATALGFAGLRSLVSAGGATSAVAAAQSGPASAPSDAGYGPLVPDPHRIIDLPDGFSYRVISREGERMDDGLRVPGNCDGTASFAGPDGRTIIVRNHELLPEDVEFGPFGKKNKLLSRVPVDKIYDRGGGDKPTPCLGGTTTIVYDARSG